MSPYVVSAFLFRFIRAHSRYSGFYHPRRRPTRRPVHVRARRLGLAVVDAGRFAADDEGWGSEQTMDVAVSPKPSTSHVSLLTPSPVCYVACAYPPRRADEPPTSPTTASTLQRALVPTVVADYDPALQHRILLDIAPPALPSAAAATARTIPGHGNNRARTTEQRERGG